MLVRRRMVVITAACFRNQVWIWDITKLATLQKRVFLMAYA